MSEQEPTRQWRTDPVDAEPGSSRSAVPAPFLQGQDILDTGPEPSFDALTEAAARIFGTAVAVIALTGGDRKRCISVHGADWGDFPPEARFCDYLLDNGMAQLVMDDAAGGGMPGLLPDGFRYCAGVPLITSAGDRIGVFCVLDPVAPLTSTQSPALLERLARTAAALIEARSTTAELRRLHAHVELSDALGAIALDGSDLATAMSAASEVLGRHLQADMVVVTQFVDAAGGIRHAASWSSHPEIRENLLRPFADLVLGVSETPSWRAIRDQKPLLVEDLEDRSLFPDNPVTDLLRQLGLRQYLVVPFRVEDARCGMTLGFRRFGVDLAWMHDRVLAIRSRVIALLERKRASDRMAFLGSILDQSGDGLSVLEIDQADPALRRFVYVNQAMSRLTGYAQGELIGAPVTILNARAEEAGVIEAAREGLAAGETVELETLNRCKSGEDIWLNLRMVPFRGASGRDQVIAAARDVGERRRMLEDLRDLEGQARRLFQQNPVPMWLHDRQSRRFLDVNEAALAQYGYTRQAFVAMHLSDLCTVAERAGAGSGGEGGLRRLNTAAGEERVVNLVAHDFKGELGNGILVAAIDVTREKSYEASLRNAKLQAEEANVSKSEFLAHMSHEMRTPLNAIIGFSEMIKQGVHGPLGAQKYYDYVEAIRESGGELLFFINDVLQLI